MLFRSSHNECLTIIYLKKKKGDSIRNIIGVSKEEKHIALVDFFTEIGEYKLAPYLEEAYRTTVPNAFQKEFKERASVKIWALNHSTVRSSYPLSKSKS